MGKQPAVVIVARHGARLDQVVKDWRNTAKKPYDPPLTYGGWTQCQTLGARIANELYSLECVTGSKSEENVAAPEPPPRKKRKVIIHTSPYLRCVQTSIAISAGLLHNQQSSKPTMRAQNRPSLSQSSPLHDEVQTKRLGIPGKDGNVSVKSAPASNQDRVHLRIDPFLGEWLSPSYFEDSIHPPPSREMLADAVDYLKSPAEEIKGADLSGPPLEDFSSIDWEDKENEISSTPTHEKSGLRAMAAKGHSLAKRPRNISFGTEVIPRTTNKPVRRASQMSQVAYSPPIPTYAMAPQDAIPIGFVAHARDKCIDCEYNWNSMDAPLQWGDGGPYDEEWGAMHRRFRNGLQKMLAYYEGCEAESDENAIEEGDEEELVVVLVTHQAGCNALIRLITGAPALHDVGLASLTLAVRKPGLQRLPSFGSVSPTRRRRGSLDLGIADGFDMKIIASTEHLRGGSNPLGLNSPRLGKSPAFASRRTVGADSPEGFSIGDPLSWRPSTGYGLGRSSSQRSSIAESGPGGTSGATGLWNRGSRYSRDETTDSDAGPSPSLKSGTTTDSIAEELLDVDGDLLKVDTNATQMPVRSASQRGLWGGESAIRRDRSPGKRRWTAVDKSP